MLLKVILFFILPFLVRALDDRKFPETFKFGIASAAYQVEGAWNESGKTPSIWDELTHNQPNQIFDQSNGDIACDSYHKTIEDVQLLKNLGVQFYRLSIAWSRIVPNGTIDHGINEAGIAYYKNLLIELQNANIDAMVTLYHWDLPQVLQYQLGGWPNRILADLFRDYAQVAFDNFAPYVKYWVTFNEPHLVCQQGYESGGKAPGIKSSGDLLYQCGHTVLLAHSKAYHLYNSTYKSQFNGQISIVLNSDWFEPIDTNPENMDAAERNRQFYFGWFANPIVFGNYPEIMIERIANRSKLEGFTKSRLPTFTDDEASQIIGTYDFIGLNHYTTAMVQKGNEAEIGEPSSSKDLSVQSYKDGSWPGSASSWLKVVPWGMRSIVNWIRKTYNDPIIFITENGTSDTGDLDDLQRIEYYQLYLSALLEAIHDDGVQVGGYTAWSLLDNFEWNRGYSEKFGLYHIDFSSANRTRTAKSSVEVMKTIIACKCIN